MFVTSRNSRCGLPWRFLARAAALTLGASLAGFSTLPAAANGIGSAYVANGGAKELTIVDVESLAAVDVIPTKGQPAGLAIDASGKFIYIAEEDTNDLLIISRDDYSTVATVPVGTAPVTVSLSQDGKRAFVVNSGSNNVSVVDTEAKSVVKTLPAGSQPSAGALLPDGNIFLVANSASNTVSFEDVNAGKSVADAGAAYQKAVEKAVGAGKVSAPYANHFCGSGDATACSKGLWAALDAAGVELASKQIDPDPVAWRADATGERIQFAPGFLPVTMRWANRPTYQQILSFDGHR